MTRAHELYLAARRYRYDPLGFAELAVPWGVKGTPFASWSEPWPMQRDFLLRVGREAYEKRYGADENGRYPRRPPILRSISSGTSTGKSAIVMPIAAFWFLATHGDARGLCVAPTGRHAADKMFNNAVALLTSSPFLRRYFDHSTGDKEWWVRGCRASRSCVYMTAESKEALSGKHAHSGCTLVEFDDAAGIDDDMFVATSGARHDPQALAIACGQPTKLHGWFYRVAHGDLAEDWNAVVWSQLDTPGADEDLRARRVRECGGVDTEDYRVQVLGLPPLADARAFIPRSLLEEAADPDRRPLHDANGAPIVPHRTPLVAGLDLARESEDGAHNAMAFASAIDGRTVRPVSAPGVSADERIAWAIQEAERPRPPYGRPCVVYYDATGLDGMWEREIGRLGRERLFRPVEFGARDPEGRYRTMRGALWSGARQWLNRGGCLPRDDALFRLVSAARSEPDSYGKLVITPKADLGARAGRTKLDEWDARMLSMLAPPPGAIDHTLGGPPRAGGFAADKSRSWAG